MTSVDPEKCQGSWKYNESFKEFLKPTLQNINLNKNKYGKRIKTYAQIIGIEAELEEEKKSRNNSEKSTTARQNPEPRKNENLNKVIEGMKEQINELKEMIQVLCKSVVKDEKIKQQCMEKLKQMDGNETKSEENTSVEKKEEGNQLEKQEMKIGNKGKRKEDERKTIRIISHPNTQSDESGQVNEVIRSWYKLKKEKEDQKIIDDHRVRKLR